VTGKDATFRIRLGPVPDRHWPCDVVVGVAPAPGAVGSGLSIRVNGTPCQFLSEESAKGELRLTSFRVPASALKGTEVHEVKVASEDQAPVSIRQVEMFLRPPAKQATEHSASPARPK
jgi:hypothetical protein